MSSQVHDGPINQRGEYREEQSGRYRAVSPTAVASLAFGALSALTVWHWAMGLIPAVGILLGYLALRQIAKTPEELTGRGLALGGLILSVAFAVLGYTVQAVVKAREFPPGYHELAHQDLQPDPSVPGERIPPKAYDSQYDQTRDNKVGVKGFMAPTRQQGGIKQFILCPSIPNCPYCSLPPTPYCS